VKRRITSARLATVSDRQTNANDRDIYGSGDAELGSLAALKANQWPAKMDASHDRLLG